MSVSDGGNSIADELLGGLELKPDVAGADERSRGAATSGAAVAPAPTNRQVQTTDEQTCSSWQPDWIAYTAPDGVSLEAAFPLLEHKDWAELDHGGYGYPASAQVGRTRVYWGRQGMGVHVEMGGQALRELEGGGHVRDWRDFLKWIREQGWKVTRFDVAVDDREGLLSRDELLDRWDAGHVTTHFATAEPRGRRRKGQGGAVDGWAVYFGSPKSDSMVRVYDKAAERRAKGEEIAEGEHHVRAEWQFRRDRATAVVDQWLIKGEVGLRMLLLGVLAFKEPTEDSNTSRWPVVDWWGKLLGVVRGCPLRLRKPELTVEVAERWLEHQVAPMLSAVVDCYRGDLEFVLQLLSAGRRRYRSRHELMIRESVRVAA